MTPNEGTNILVSIGRGVSAGRVEVSSRQMKDGTMKDVDFERCEIIPKLPNGFGPNRAEDVPGDLAGATILAFGSLPGSRFEGPLALDYRTSEGTVRRLVIGFSEVGAWIAFAGVRPEESSPAARNG